MQKIIIKIIKTLQFISVIYLRLKYFLVCCGFDKVPNFAMGSARAQITAFHMQQEYSVSGTQ